MKGFSGWGPLESWKSQNPENPDSDKKIVRIRIYRIERFSGWGPPESWESQNPENPDSDKNANP